MEFNKQTTSVRSSASEAVIDQGLRAYMLKGLQLHGFWCFTNWPNRISFFQNGGGYI